jgi:3D-(3,5/4)-trihydroxycyclohexane-1,2-dione acylhydrolase (decyclizing)
VRTRRLTTARALVEFLAAQHSERDGAERRFFAGMFGIFGHGNVAGLGQALREAGDRLRYVPARNEQAMVHAAAAYARMANRLATYACTSSIGPGATNMITAAAGATINRVPVLLLPGDIFATRQVAPVLQQLESPASADVSVNDCFRPVSRYWDRINRPEQLPTALLEAMRVLTSPADTGAVTLALPEDVQSEAGDFPEELFARRVWRIRRPRPDPEALAEAARWIRAARRPLVVAGGGVAYSEAGAVLRAFVEATGVPVGETQAGKGSLPYDHPSNLGALGVTGTPGANIMAREADLVIGVGTRYADFTTASKSAFQDPGVRFVNVNVAEADAGKHAGLALVADARAALEALPPLLAGWQAPAEWRARAARFSREWDEEVARIYARGHGPLPSQGEVIGAVNDAAEPRDVVVCAAGSLPGDLHKLWRTRDAKGYHLEYGYSCMGYEVAGALGVKLAAPDREVFAMVGDGSWLMMSSELVTALQEGVKLTVVLVDNGGFASIGGLSESLGAAGFGTRYRARGADGQLSGEPLRVDFVANARSLGVEAVSAPTIAALRAALAQARRSPRSTVIVIETDREARVGGYESWWDVPPAAVTDAEEVRAARRAYEEARRRQRWHLGAAGGKEDA